MYSATGNWKSVKFLEIFSLGNLVFLLGVRPFSSIKLPITNYLNLRKVMAKLTVSCVYAKFLPTPWKFSIWEQGVSWCFISWKFLLRIGKTHSESVSIVWCKFWKRLLLLPDSNSLKVSLLFDFNSWKICFLLFTFTTCFNKEDLSSN